MKGITFENTFAFAEIGSTEKLINESIKRIVMTGPNERPNFLDFGFGIKRYLFQSLGTISAEFKPLLKAKIETYEPRILIQDIQVLQGDNINKVVIKFKYVIKTSYLDEHNLTLEVGL